MKENQNYKQLLSEQYTRGELPVLSRKDTFKFTCVQCGECCRNRDDVLLTPFDVFRLCKATGLNAAEFIMKYCSVYPGGTSKLPIVSIKYRPVYNGSRVIGTRCPFLGKRDGLHFCRVQDAKPFVCFSYPLGKVCFENTKTEYILQSDCDCAGARKATREDITQVVEDWMLGEEKLDMEERYSEIFYGFLTNYRSWINVDELAENKKALPLYKKWLVLVADLLYCSYDFSADETVFLEQLKVNISMIEELCKVIVTELSRRF